MCPDCNNLKIALTEVLKDAGCGCPAVMKCEQREDGYWYTGKYETVPETKGSCVWCRGRALLKELGA